MIKQENSYLNIKASLTNFAQWTKVMYTFHCLHFYFDYMCTF